MLIECRKAFYIVGNIDESNLSKYGMEQEKCCILNCEQWVKA